LCGTPRYGHKYSHSYNQPGVCYFNIVLEGWLVNKKNAGTPQFGELVADFYCEPETFYKHVNYYNSRIPPWHHSCLNRASDAEHQKSILLLFKSEVMKNVKLSLAALGISALSFFAFTSADTGSIKGKVMPAEAAIKAWAISKTDTFQSEITQGQFEVKDLKPGTYKLVIEAKAPYKSIGKEGITVTDASVDVGEIKLNKQ
jgi:hypothetical protein